MSRWTDEILDGFAGHVRYEVDMLVGQVEWLADHYRCEIPDDGFAGHMRTPCSKRRYCTSVYSTTF